LVSALANALASMTMQRDDLRRERDEIKRELASLTSRVIDPDTPSQGWWLGMVLAHCPDALAGCASNASSFIFWRTSSSFLHRKLAVSAVVRPWAIRQVVDIHLGPGLAWVCIHRCLLRVADVIRATNQKQVPSDHSSLVGELVLARQ
jgi:hypothetical protein